MDDSERLVNEYLNGLGLGTAVFEPDGKVPPDFILPGGIAVEVRRLNQNYVSSAGASSGLEEVSIPISRKFQSFLPTLGPSLRGECWYVCISFRRPLLPWRKLRREAVARLQGFMSSAQRVPTTISITETLEIALIRAGKDHGSFFVLGGCSDEDAGGWVFSELDRNIRLCLAEKEAKVAPYRSRYLSWWLVLVDHIAYAIDEEDRETFRSEIVPRLSHSFDRLVLLDPRRKRSPFLA